MPGDWHITTSRITNLTLKRSYMYIALVAIFTALTVRKEMLMRSWIIRGSRPEEYEVGVDDSTTYNGKRSAFIKSIVAETGGFGTLMQSCRADAYHGKRVRFAAAVKTMDVSGWAGLWMRVDGPNQNEPLAFDNMKDRPIAGTTDWQAYEVVLDVPAGATFICFGILVRGSGHAWLSDVRFEEADGAVLTTASDNARWGYVDKPVNLDFSE